MDVGGAHIEQELDQLLGDYEAVDREPFSVSDRERERRRRRITDKIKNLLELLSDGERPR